MLFVRLVVEIIQRWNISFAKPLWPCIKIKVIEMSVQYAVHKSEVFRHAKFECHNLDIVRGITIKLQVKIVSRLRGSCDLKSVIRLEKILCDPLWQKG